MTSKAKDDSYTAKKEKVRKERLQGTFRHLISRNKTLSDQNAYLGIARDWYPFYKKILDAQNLQMKPKAQRRIHFTVCIDCPRKLRSARLTMRLGICSLRAMSS